MCGICGVIAGRSRSAGEVRATVRIMTERLRHRGPDAHAIWGEDGAAFGHTRLSIIDLAGSSQPMVDPSGRFVIVFNGEIYNYIELREELRANGAVFVTRGDTEVLLTAYLAYGSDCLEKLNGMFAFAVWDREKKELFAARDRLGVKPFYYGQGEDDLFVFASELQACKGLPLDFSLNGKALRHYLRHGFIWSPDTIFSGVRELRPGHWLRLDKSGLVARRYWSPPHAEPDWETRREADLAAELRQLVASAVRLRLRSDVPIGAFLSGGLDSSIITALMCKERNAGVHTFSIGFAENTFDESPQARAVAACLGTEHHASREELRPADLLARLVRHYGQPYGDSSAIPTWHLCQRTRQQVTVALSGDGADELFGGYRRYQARRLLAFYQRIPRFLREKIIGAVVEKLPEGTGYYDSSLRKKLRLFVALDRRVSRDPSDIYPAYFRTDELAGLVDGLTPAENDVAAAGTKIGSGATVTELVELMMRSDLLHYLPDDILVKVDRASMAHGLEVRSPFMDYRLVEFACRLPLRFKLRGGIGKYLLRRAFAGDLPAEPLQRPKHGFAVPVGDWFQGELRDLFRDTVLADNRCQLVSRKTATRLLAEHQAGRVDHGYRLWLLLFLHLWQEWWHGR